MNRRHPRSSGKAADVAWLGAAVGFVLGIAVWASETPPDEASALFGTTELSAHMGSTGGTVDRQAGLPKELYGDSEAAPVSDKETAHLEAGIPNRAAAPNAEERPGLMIVGSRAEVWRAGIELAKEESHAPRETEEEPAQPSADAAPNVEVRVGDHGAFERVVFEWPEGIEYEVAQRGAQVTVAFSRPGRIDLSLLRDGSRLSLVQASAAGGEITDHVVLQVVPEARIRTFALEDGRIVAIDVYAEAAPRTALSAAPEPEQNSVQALRAALEQRDEVIEDLVVRMEQLERRLALSSPDLDTVVAGGAGAAGGGRGAPSAPAGTQAAQPTPEPAEASGQQSSSQGQGANDQAAPGEFDVDEQDVDRALERTLVQTGALLLPLGQVEVEPSFSYTRREGSVPVLFTENGATFIAEQDVRRNEFESGQIVRVGMPFDSQVEIGVPYQYVDQSSVTRVGGQERQEVDGSGQGLGDISVGVAKTLLRENGGWWPDLVGRLTWDSDTGETTDGDVLLGGSFHELRGSLNAVKRQDPLAFVGGVSYQTTFEKDNVKPGDELGFSFGAVLAASPETSLRLALGQRFIDDATLDGEGIDGSDRVVGTATFGASVVLGRGVLLDVAADIGLTDDAPDYAARASLPIRFDLPVY